MPVLLYKLNGILIFSHRRDCIYKLYISTFQTYSAQQTLYLYELVYFVGLGLEVDAGFYVT